MITWYHYVLLALVLVSLVLSVYFSIRYRRSKEPLVRGLFAAKMNIAMGTMLMCIALIQFLLFEPSFLRGAIGAVFLILGLFNVYAGSRNHSSYSKRLKS
ncbi:YtpI family protein [Paenibacillus senegalensis]|uniref:YtpI family protein n=1 Tax=Paenibacillus senegalensis TaxID=1465766 RepID=UPI00028907EA|nr:YtpI family protein [Paenibacillus senegalensis]